MRFEDYVREGYRPDYQQYALPARFSELGVVAGWSLSSCLGGRHRRLSHGES